MPDQHATQPLQAPAGFYPDANQSSLDRWWDGSQWTEVTRHRQGQYNGLSRRWSWRRISNFSSRARRSEFWASIAISAAVSFAAGFLDYLLLGDGVFFSLLAIVLWIWLVWGAAVNRLHDMGSSGWLALLFLIPFVNFVVLIWIGSGEGQPHANKWGPPVV